MQERMYSKLASAINARIACDTIPRNDFGFNLHSDTLDQLEKILPSGSGIDSGTKIDLERSRAERIVLTTSFHHMNDVGMYDGWTDHDIIITPSLQFGFNLRITGSNRREIKDYLYEVYHYALMDMIDSEVIPDDPIQLGGIEVTRIKYFSVSIREAAKEYRARVASGEIT